MHIVVILNTEKKELEAVTVVVENTVENCKRALEKIYRAERMTFDWIEVKNIWYGRLGSRKIVIQKAYEGIATSF